MKRYTSIFSILLLALFFCSKPIPRQMEGQQIKPWSIKFGEQGGYTGRQTVHQISQNGSVLAVSKLPAGESKVDTVKILDQEAIHHIQTQIMKTDLLNIDINEKGNMVSFIHLIQDSSVHKIQWKRGTELPKPLKTLFQELKTAVK